MKRGFAGRLLLMPRLSPKLTRYATLLYFKGAPGYMGKSFSTLTHERISQFVFTLHSDNQNSCFAPSSTGTQIQMLSFFFLSIRRRVGQLLTYTKRIYTVSQ
jgi:hypothetical protein